MDVELRCLQLARICCHTLPRQDALWPNDLHRRWFQFKQSGLCNRVRHRVWVLLDCIQLYLNLKRNAEFASGDFAHAKVARDAQIEANLNLCWKWEAHKQKSKEVWIRHD